jgi:hypothetical protein
MPISITSGFNPGGMSVGCAGLEPDGDGNAAASALIADLEAVGGWRFVGKRPRHAARAHPSHIRLELHTT